MGKSKKVIAPEVAPVAELAKALPIVAFENWWVLRQAKIPVHHRKEIIRADFNARGVSGHATMEEFDRALARYGVKID